MFAVPSFGNFYQPFNAGFAPSIGQYGQPFTAQFNPLIAAQLASVNPFAQPQIGGYGVNPLALAAMTGSNPFLSQQHLLGSPTGINPFLSGQLPTMSPLALPYLTQQILGSGFRPQPHLGALGIQSQLGLINPFTGQTQQPLVNEAGHFGYTPFGIQQGWQGAQGLGNTSPWANPFYAQANPFGQFLPGIAPQQAFTPNLPTAHLSQDPFINASLYQQKLPIRPLVNPQQMDPGQSGISGLSGMVGNPLTDPNFALNQACLAQYGISPLQQQYGISPLQQQMPRGYSLNWGGSPYSIGQASPFAQTGAPFNV